MPLYLGLDVGTQVWCLCKVRAASADMGCKQNMGAKRKAARMRLQSCTAHLRSPECPPTDRGLVLQSTKAVIYDVDTGSIVGRGAAAYDLLPSDVPGRAEQHPSTWLEVWL